MQESEELKALGNSYFKKRDYRKAIEYYSKAIDLYQSPFYYTNRCTCYMILKDFHNAVKDGLTAISLDPNFEKGYFKTGSAYKKMGDLERAMEYF